MSTPKLPSCTCNPPAVPAVPCTSTQETNILIDTLKAIRNFAIQFFRAIVHCLSSCFQTQLFPASREIVHVVTKREVQEELTPLRKKYNEWFDNEANWRQKFGFNRPGEIKKIKQRMGELDAVLDDLTRCEEIDSEIRHLQERQNQGYTNLDSSTWLGNPRYSYSSSRRIEFAGSEVTCIEDSKDYISSDFGSNSPFWSSSRLISDRIRELSTERTRLEDRIRDKFYQNRMIQYLHNEH